MSPLKTSQCSLDDVFVFLFSELLLAKNGSFVYCLFLPVGFPSVSDGKESSCSAGDPVSILGLGRSPWRREWLPTPVFLPGEFHGQRSLAATVHGVTKSRTRLSNFHEQTLTKVILHHYREGRTRKKIITIYTATTQR